MSSVILFRQSDRVTVLTDGSCYEMNGTLIGHTPKVVPVPHLNAAIAIRGQSAALALVLGTLTQKADAFEDVEKVLPDVLELLTPNHETQTGDVVDLYVAGFGPDGPDSYVMVNHSHHRGVSPFQATRTGPLCVAPGSRALEARMQELKPADAQTVDDIDPDDFGLEIIEEQRRERFELVGDVFGEEKSIVGSFAQMTTIWPDRIETKILRRWPDQRGKPIAA